MERPLFMDAQRFGIRTVRWLVGPILNTMSGAIRAPQLAATLANYLRETTERVAHSLDDAARASNNWVGGVADELRDAGAGWRNGDAVGAAAVHRISNNSGRRGPWLIGWDGSTRHYTFEPHQVRSIPLVDHEGRLIGVSFPTHTAGPHTPDEEAYSRWSRMPNRLSDREFLPESLVHRNGASRPDWEDQGPAQPAPWAEDAKDGMLYVHAHSGPRGFEIAANVGTDGEPDRRILLVPGSFFGHVLAADRHFQAASRAGPDKPLLMLSCSAGNPAYGHAEQAAGVLHREGMDHDVYATVGINRAEWNMNEGRAQVRVEVPANSQASDAITVIRAPSRPPAT